MPAMPESVKVLLEQKHTVNLYKAFGEGHLAQMLVEKQQEGEAGSNQPAPHGRMPHPIDTIAVTNYQTANVHHSACIFAKVNSCVGIGYENEDENTGVSPTDELLNPLTSSTWQETQSDVAEDYYQCGWGFLEVVREGTTIVGLFHLPVSTVYLHRDQEGHVWYEIVGAGGMPKGSVRHAPFGLKEQLIAEEVIDPLDDDPNTVSEIICLRRPTSLSRWYGFPDWISASPAIELVQMMIQQKFDFFINRGVPEFIALFTGGEVPKEDWDRIEAALRAQTGPGNAHKSLALNIKDSNLQFQLEKLAMDGDTDKAWSADKENLAMDVVSAHRVPPLLAGIQIPGKLGATNELPNALAAFQLLVIGPDQRRFQQTLGTTLGGSEAGVPGLTMGHFKYKKITDELNLEEMDTMSRMREPAAGSGRDLSDGLKD